MIRIGHDEFSKHIVFTPVITVRVNSSRALCVTEFSRREKKEEKKNQFSSREQRSVVWFLFSAVTVPLFFGIFYAPSPPQLRRRRHGLRFAHRQRPAQKRPENELNPVPSSKRGELVRVRTVETIFSSFFYL